MVHRDESRVSNTARPGAPGVEKMFMTMTEQVLKASLPSEEDATEA